MVSRWSSPNPVVFGCGTSARTGEFLKEFECKKVIVIYDKGVEASAKKILASIAAEGIDYVTFDGVQPDAPDVVVNEAAALARRENVDGVVAIGGGSAVDTGKGTCVLLTNDPPINKYFARPSEPPACDVTHLKPIIVIPTTAGTGTEVTPGGAIADTTLNTKENVVCPTSLGIVDPELTLGLPKSSTIATGIDAMCHAIEAFISNEPNCFSDLLAETGISLIAQNLPKVVKDGSDLKARENQMRAATMCAMSILGPYCNIGHDTGAVLCMEFPMVHGISVSCCLPEIMRFVAPSTPEKVSRILRCLGAEVPEGIDGETLGDLAYDTFKAFMKSVDYPNMKQFIPSREALLATVPKIMETQTFHFSPRHVEESDIVTLFNQMWDRNCAEA